MIQPFIRNPALLPKVRSASIMDAPKLMQHPTCTLRIASFIPGHACAGMDTVVMSHGAVGGKGISSKTTDISCCLACSHCHALIERQDNRITYIEEHFPAALWDRILRGQVETWTHLIMAGIIQIPDGELLFA